MRRALAGLFVAGLLIIVSGLATACRARPSTVDREAQRRASPLFYYVDHQMPKAVGDSILLANGVTPEPEAATCALCDVPAPPIVAQQIAQTPVGAKQFITVQPGDTIALTMSNTAGPEGACFKQIGSSRTVVLPCGGAGGFHMFLRVYHGKVIVANATFGDTLAFLLPVSLATRTTACDSALVRSGIRFDTTIAKRPPPCSP